ncbi:complement regulator-acquiring protein (plasmid) [Borreliella americana]
MKYHVITTILVFLFLACRPDFNADKKEIKYPPTEKSKPKTEDSKQKESKPKTEEELKKKQEEEEPEKKQLKNTLLNDLKEQIDSAYNFKEKYVKSMKKEPADHYGMTSSFRGLNWGPGTEKMSDNTERSIRFRRHVYTILSPLDPHELKKFADIMQHIRTIAPVINIFNSFSTIGGAIDVVSDHLYPKKDNLDKLNIVDLETIKNSFEQILYIKGSVAGKSKKLLLDYNNLLTDDSKLESYSNELANEIKQQALEADNLKRLIVSKYNP